ncbi:MAG: trypsin-like peptidase domain-containing protein [Treponema sp.]|nr:trypsin-like peptidase domain-containing protein [Treponema sp.]
MVLLVFILFAACGTVKVQEERLAPRRSAGEIRFDDIKNQVPQNPVMAIDLVAAYREAYRITGEEAEAQELLALENEAIENLKSFLEKAASEERWDDAASYRRSLACLEAPLSGAPQTAAPELDYVLAGAKKKLLDGDNLGAFLAAAQVHEQRPLSADDALLFLERAVSVKQRRSAACFFAAVEKAGGAGKVSAEIREYARGSDSVSDMIKGVATVLVDRGIKIERGRGYADRVLGSAFFIDASGLMVTNYHVIASEVDTKYKGYSRMYIRMGDSTSARIPARVVGWDKALDLALIKTEYTSEFVFSVVDRVIPRVGETVFAIGSPVGLEKTVTSGIVSALSRRILQIGDVYQIDAAVNPGNSGGPVVDTSGRLVGIVFAGIEFYAGLNFAIPAERLAAALPAMMQGGKAERPWLGLTLSENSSGAEIIYIAPNTPAALHRVPEGGVIKSLNGREIKTPHSLLIPALQDAVFQSRPGELVALETLDPNGELKRRLMITVPRPELPLGDAAKLDSHERLTAPLFGMILAPYGKSWPATYLVRKIVRGSIADEANISEQDPVSIRGFRIYEKEGYVLMEINIKKRSMGYLETSMQLPARLDSPDTL